MISSLFIILSHSYPQGGPLVISWFINFTAYIVSYIYIYLYYKYIYIYIYHVISNIKDRYWRYLAFLRAHLAS